jgi:3-hydroxy-3-methylglutaryl CoA synthase
MGKYEKLFTAILSGRKNKSIRFNELTNLLLSMGFKGSHHIFYHEDVDEILNLQPIGSEAKPYQVKQVRNIILKYHLEEPNE